MKNLIAAASALALVSLAPVAAQAQTASEKTGVYFNLGYANAHVDDINLGGVQGRLGYRFSDHFGVEGEASIGVTEDTIHESGLDVDFRLKHAEAIYAVGFLPVGANTDVLGRLGYGHAEIEGTAAGVHESGGDEAWAIGIGIEHHFEGGHGLRADYTRHEFNDEGSADVWSLAYTHKF